MPWWPAIEQIAGHLHPEASVRGAAPKGAVRRRPRQDADGPWAPAGEPGPLVLASWFDLHTALFRARTV